jgi:ubiquinone biosynthesis protein COQ9
MTDETVNQIEARRDALMLATLRHVPFDGWSDRAIRAGAKELGLDDAAADNLLPGGAEEVMALFHNWADREMLLRYEATKKDDLRTRDRAALALKLRLRACLPYREAVRQGVGFLAQPLHVPLATRMTWRTCDAVWHALGDSATDFNYYTKRGLLAAVYGAAVMYWLSDKSDDMQATEEFIDRRIADVMQVPRLMGELRKAAGRFPNPLRVVRGFRPNRDYRRF